MDDNFNLNVWGIQDRGEAFLRETFPALKRTEPYQKYTGFQLSTMVMRTHIRCVVRKFNTDRRAIKSYEDIIDVLEDLDVFPSNELIAQIALVVG
jgi:hypothetical protein